VFMSNRLSGPVARIAAISVAVLAFSGSALHAQTAPQLLPYTSRLIAGGGTQVIPKTTGACPISGNTPLDTYGDGCLATEIEIGNTASGGSTPGSRGAVADASGNIFFTDYNAALVRRVDAITGIVTAVAGGGTAAAGTSSGSLATAVKYVHPAGIVFAPNGDLYFSDCGNGQVFKIGAVGGVITSASTSTLVAGSTAGTYGYGASNGTTTVSEANGNSLLHFPFGLAFDSKGDLFIVDEYTEAILVLNTSTTTNVVNTVSVAPGTIWKIAGSITPGSATTPNATDYCTNTSGCNYGLYVENVQANGNEFDSTYSVAVDPNGVVYGGNEYYDSVYKVTTTGVMSTFAGVQNAVGAKPTIAKRGAAGSFGIGSVFGVVSDSLGNIYVTDASSGVVWRVDASGSSMYVVAGGATTVCAAATDTNGDGCPATQATFGHSGSGNYATATLPGPGIYAVSVDAYSDLFVGDTETNLVREIASGTQFGIVGANQPTDIVDIHFAQGDVAAGSSPYVLTAGASNFSLGTATCTLNSDSTTDCLLPVTATPTVLGSFTGTLQVTSKLGGVGNFPLSGVYVQSPVTRTSVSYTSSATCSGTTTYSTTTSVTATAIVTANGPAPPVGTADTITFTATNTATNATINLGTVPVSNIGTTAAPVYGAVTAPFTLSTIGTYSISATYSGDSYFKPSTGKSPSTITTAAPTYTLAAVAYQQNTVTAGQTALYSFTTTQTVYSGTISFAVTGLPANATYALSPSSIIAAGCSTTSTVALSIYTQQKTTVQPGSFASGRGMWSMITALSGMLLALAIGLRRRRIRFAQVWMVLALLLATTGTVACGKAVGSTLQPATPSGTYTITVTPTGSTGTSPAPITFQLTVQ